MLLAKMGDLGAKRKLHLAPAGRPHWLPAQHSGSELGFELSYLSWGSRWYGTAPIEPSVHEGWHYFVTLEGTPIVIIGGQKIRARPGFVFVAHPDCAVGHADEPRKRCRILTWIWRAPPTHSALQPASGAYLRLHLGPAQLRRLTALNAECHRAVAVASERSMLELRAARIALDLCLLDAREHSHAADGEIRFKLAVEYLRNHLADEKPVERAGEYLQVSAASLKRLFQTHAGKSPRDYLLDWRMRSAAEQLQRDAASVKSVAFALGYKHANDFSRAFKRHQGFEARRLLQLPAPATAAVAGRAR